MQLAVGRQVPKGRLANSRTNNKQKTQKNADQAMTLSEARLLVPRSDDYGEANNKQSQTK